MADHPIIGTPTKSPHAANKGYVDAGLSALAAAVTAAIAAAIGAGRGATAVLQRVIFAGVASTQQASGNPLVLGAIYWDPAVSYGQTATGSVFLHAMVETSNASNGVVVDLYQFTGAGSPVVVGSTTVSTSTTTTHVTVDLTSLFKAGGTAVAAVYKARVYLATNNGQDYATSSGAWLEITP